MKDKVDFEIIRKYTKGTHSFHELKKLARWFENENSYDELKEAVEPIWDEFEIPKHSEDKDMHVIFSRLKNDIRKGKDTPALTKRILTIYFRVAAILLIPLLIYSSYSVWQHFSTVSSNMRWVEINAPYGAATHFALPDGTKVSLNSGSRLKYNVEFNKERKLTVDGEAYFDVRHDASHPFIVKTDVMDVRVLGTKFSISAFSQDNDVSVVLEKGKVQLTGTDKAFSEVLQPDERFVYDRSLNKGTLEKVDASYLTSWKDGLLVFRNEPLSEVIERIGRWYNVRFDIKDQEIMDFRYRATFRNESLDEVLKLISLTAPIQYEIKEREQNKANDQYETKNIEIRMKR